MNTKNAANSTLGRPSAISTNSLGIIAASFLAWDHVLSLLSLYVSHGKRASFFPPRAKEAKKQNK